MKKIQILSWRISFPLFVLAIMLLTGCKSAYVVSDFESKTASHKTIAILPFEMSFTGVKPEKLSEADLIEIGEAESKAFMISFYNELLASTKGGKKPIRVDVQHFDRTLNILKGHKMNMHDAWTEDPVVLAEVLGVDAVVKGRIQKNRLMSDLASYGIDLGMRILNVLTDYSVLFWLPSDLSKSNEVKTSYSLVNTDGSVIWSIAFDEDADWSKPANELIDELNRKAAKQFPYRK